jgi:membrane-associated phospholipid phosphatase
VSGKLFSGSAFVVALLSGGGASARADARSPTQSPAWLVDGGAVPLFWISLGAEFAVDRWVAPRSTPLWFSPHDGGAPPASWEVPDWTLYVVGVGVATTLALGDDPSRWYHVKGLAESMATAGLVMTVAKKVFGRHRPDWSPKDTASYQRESFPSGHPTEAFAIATYAALYLHDHVFGDRLTVGAGLAYTGIFASAGLVAAERVVHHRHFLSDVAIGALVGATVSALIYRYQEQRATTDGAVAAPSASPGGHATVLSFRGAF